MAIPQSFIQELVARADVVEIVGRYVQLKKGGANYMGLCPFHGEKSPSFSVSPSKQFYHCFGCGKNGNAISFLMDHVGMSFVEAVKDLAQQYGMQVPEDDVSPQERERAAAQRQKQATLSDVLERAGEAYRKHLRESPRAIAYLKGRGVSGEIAKTFGLGYAPEGWRSLASVFPDYNDPLLTESGLVISNAEDAAEPGREEKRYDRFRDRVMFPIRNVKGECIGFGGRVLGDEKPKYLNSPETPVFSKGRELYGLFEARFALREAGYVLVTEGYMDVVALAQLGFANAVATLGTACTPDHVQKLFRFTDSVVFSFDGDAAGRRAARKALDGALPYATDVRSVKFLFLPPDDDPDSFIRAHGADAFAQCVKNAVPLSRFLVEAAGEGCDMATAEGRAHFAANAKPLWSLMPEGALRQQLLGEIADQVQLGTQELAALWGYKNNSTLLPFHGAPRPDSFRSAAARPASGRLRGRQAPASRADHAVRALLTDCALWDSLSGEEHTMLCELPEPHGPLFAWIEVQLHEHGPQPWAALREGLRGHPLEAFALRAVAQDEVSGGTSEDQPEPSSRQNEVELRDLLRRMLVAHLKTQENKAIAQAGADPDALQRYKALHERRKALETSTLV